MGYTTFVLIAAFLSTVASQAPFDPEEMLFIYTRCMEDNLKDDSSRLETFLKWKDWQLEPANDPATHSYVKCVLDKVGLYNPTDKKFDPTVIEKQVEKYPNLADKNQVNAYAKAVEQLPTTDNVPKKVFDAFNKIFNDHKSIMKNLFHGNKEQTSQIYSTSSGTIRKQNQSYFEFCEDKYYPVGSTDRPKLCKIRKYEVLNDDVFKKHTDCLMKGLRYITKSNELDREEIKRDFKEVGKDTKKLDQELDKCKKPTEDVAWEYYKCLVESAVVEDFKEAFDYREVRSQYYAYHLREKKAYSKPSVQSEVMKIDGKQCPS